MEERTTRIRQVAPRVIEAPLSGAGMSAQDAEREAIPQFLEDTPDSAQAVIFEGGRKAGADALTQREHVDSAPEVVEALFREIQQSMQAMSAPEREGVAGILEAKCEALQRAYAKDVWHLPDALERFESTVEELERQVRALERRATDAHKQERRGQEGWRSRVLEVLVQAQASGELPAEDIVKANVAFEALAPAVRVDYQKQLRLDRELLKVAQRLVATLRPEAATWKTRKEQGLTPERRLQELYHQREELINRMANLAEPSGVAVDTELQQKHAKGLSSAAQREIFEKEMKLLLRAFEQLQGQIERLRLQAPEVSEAVTTPVEVGAVPRVKRKAAAPRPEQAVI